MNFENEPTLCSCKPSFRDNEDGCSKQGLVLADATGDISYTLLSSYPTLYWLHQVHYLWVSYAGSYQSIMVVNNSPQTYPDFIFWNLFQC